MLSQITGGLVAYYIGIAIVALPGLIGVVLIGRMHRTAIRDCRKLQEEVARAEQSTTRVRCLLSDLVATMNLSLASAGSPQSPHREQIDQIRAAAEDALRLNQTASPGAS